MRPLFDDTVLIHHKDAVHMRNRRQMMGNGDHGFVLHQFPKAGLNGGFDFAVQGACYLIKKKMGAFIRITRASAMRWRCPPESLIPRSPTWAS